MSAPRLTGPQRRALEVLASWGGQWSLSRLEGVNSRTAVALESAGLVERLPPARARYGAWYRLTDAGRAALSGKG